MYNDDGVENALENNSFILFVSSEEIICFEGRVVQVDVVHLKVPIFCFAERSTFLILKSR